MGAKSESDHMKPKILESEFDSLWRTPENENIADYILHKVDCHAKAKKDVCVINALTGETLSYTEIPFISKNIASKLFKLGLSFGDTVIYSTHDPTRVHVFMLGVWRANGIVRSSYPEDVGDTLIKRIRESKAKFVACDSHLLSEYLAACSAITEWKVNVIAFGEYPHAQFYSQGNVTHIKEFYEDDGSALPQQSRKLNDIALILATSGTTGESKGALYPHRLLLENLATFEKLPFTDDDSSPTIITSRQTHFCGSIIGLSFITKGQILLQMNHVTVENLLVAVDKYKPRAILGFPKYLLGLVNHQDCEKYDLTSLRFLASAGQVIVPETLSEIKKFSNLKHFINLYGMTEAGLLVTSADWAAAQNGKCIGLDISKPFSVGKLPPNTMLKVLDLDSGLPLGPNSHGELCFKTPLLIPGYLGQEEIFRDGWIKTGDVGYFDKDGYVFILDRAKEIFKYFNNHICPSEIENLLLTHPAITDAAVIGIPDPEGGGSIPRAFVVLQDDNVVSEEDILKFAEENLPSYKQLKGGLVILPQLPVGKTGKVTRKLLAKFELPRQG